MATDVYVLVGNAGDYEDRSSWVVAVFDEQDRADHWANRCKDGYSESSVVGPSDPF
jgi:hypothetical protein